MVRMYDRTNPAILGFTEKRLVTTKIPVVKTSRIPTMSRRILSCADGLGELVLEAIRADGRRAHDCLAEAGEDCTAKDSFVALDLAGRGAVKSGGEHEEDEERPKRDGVVVIVRND
jgi:hypothetical protein